jgi:hypothetical protein
VTSLTVNANGTILVLANPSGTYTLATDGTLTVTDASGASYQGAVTGDATKLVLGRASGSPWISFGVKQ